MNNNYKIRHSFLASFTVSIVAVCFLSPAIFGIFYNITGLLLEKDSNIRNIISGSFFEFDDFSDFLHAYVFISLFLSIQFILPFGIVFAYFAKKLRMYRLWHAVFIGVFAGALIDFLIFSTSSVTISDSALLIALSQFMSVTLSTIFWVFLFKLVGWRP